MGIRRAIQSDVARIMEIRHSVRENRLSDPNLVTGKDCAEFIERSEMWVWEEDGIVQAFAAGDIRDGWIWALFVAPEYEGRGIGRALLSMACETLRNAGYTVANLSTAAGTRAQALLGAIACARAAAFRSGVWGRASRISADALSAETATRTRCFEAPPTHAAPCMWLRSRRTRRP